MLFEIFSSRAARPAGGLRLEIVFDRLALVIGVQRIIGAGERRIVLHPRGHFLRHGHVGQPQFDLDLIALFRADRGGDRLGQFHVPVVGLRPAVLDRAAAYRMAVDRPFDGGGHGQAPRLDEARRHLEPRPHARVLQDFGPEADRGAGHFLMIRLAGRLRGTQSPLPGKRSSTSPSHNRTVRRWKRHLPSAHLTAWSSYQPVKRNR